MFLTFDNQLNPDEFSPEHLGGKGHGLFWMHKNGVPVPPAAVFPTTVCVKYMADPKGTMKEVAKSLKGLMEYLSFHNGDILPLMSVRSGARVSMPGMMDTILNVGLDAGNFEAWEARIGSLCTEDSYRRLIAMYGSVVKGIEKKKLEAETTHEALMAYKELTGEVFPGAEAQLLHSIEAVFKSWNNERAVLYRKMHNIPSTWGTAVVVQAMVFGNMDDNSGTGVLFSRNPDSGENSILGEFLPNAQGEDVVAGEATPHKMFEDVVDLVTKQVKPSMMSWNPTLTQELGKIAKKLESLRGFPQDIEFTVQQGKLFILQTRNAKVSPAAAVRIALEMYKEGTLTREEALKQCPMELVDKACRPMIDPAFKEAPMATGIPACSGIVTGVVALSSADAVKMAASGAQVILVTEETNPDDLAGMVASVGVLTMKGGSTSHAAVVARSLNRTCIVGLGIEHHSKFKAGASVSIDGGTGRVWLKEVPVVAGQSENVDDFIASVVLSNSKNPVTVETPPKFRMPHIAFDLTPYIGCQIMWLINMIQQVSKCCDQLTLVVRDEPAYWSTFLTDDGQNKWLLQLSMALKNNDHGLVYSTMGWTHPTGGHTVEVVKVDNLKDLILLTGSALYEGKLPNDKATKKVLQWLKKDGIVVTPATEAGLNKTFAEKVWG